MTSARALLVCFPLALLVALPISRAAAQEPASDGSSQTSAAAAPPPASAKAAIACVERLHAVLLDVMKNAKTLGYSGRANELQPAVAAAYNLPFMARKSVGSTWSKLTDAERAQFLKLFGDLTVANYAGRFTGWSGEHFETLGSEPGVHDTILVKTQIVRPGDDNVTLDYRLHETPGHGWQIIDVYMNGTISELALRRSEYTAMLRREGFPALVEALDKKITDLSKG